MKKLLPNLSRIPPKVSFMIIGASLVFSYVLSLGTAIAFDLGGWMRDSINDQYRKLTSPDKPAQQIQRRVEEWQRSQCDPQPVPVQSTPIAPTLPGDRLVRVDDDRSGLTDPIAIALFNIAPGNTGRAVVSRVGQPSSSSQRAMSDYYNTADGKIAVKYERRNGLSRVVSVEFVR